ncbi:hypothetical protein O181_086257 [Austropuccinia psidii MF-1]|uniref:Uncharacterized protein n=1 Tax=Austropuccinia psidii MF-1 TaxID=1389203 RepID=A0A9Q3FZG8_9BASI|nr:hypothetical protein [Austropuccinia psidii MF-1]
MCSKLTELTESSPSAPPPSVLCGSGLFSQLSSPSMAACGWFDPSQAYDGYRAVEVHDPSCTEYLAKGKDQFQHYNPQSSKCHFCFVGKQPCRCTTVPSSNVRRQRDVARWTSVGGPIPVGGRPIYSSSEVPISRNNTAGVVKVVKRITRIDDYPTDPDAEGSDELDGEEVQVVPHSVGHPSSNSSTQPLANRFQSQVIPSTPRTFQPILASIPTTIPPPSPSTSHARPALNPEVNHNHLPPTPAEEEMDCPLCRFLPLKFFKEENVGLSGLPEKIPTRLVKTKKLWPDYSGGLIEIAER